MQSVLAGRTLTGSIAARMNIDGKNYLNFYGTGYLALSQVREIRRAALGALRRGAPFSQQLPMASLGGIDSIFDAVEGAGAIAGGTEACVYFASGCQIGGVGLAGVGRLVDLILLDEYAHFNLVDAAKRSGLPFVTFSHCDVDSLSDKLKLHGGKSLSPLLMTDGVFATTGRVAPLAEYVAALEFYNGRVFIDESHAFGVIGDNGRGAGEYLGVEQSTTFGTTLSKAICAQGAIVGCTRSMEKHLRISPTLRGSCAGSPISAAAAAASLNYLAKRPDLRKKLGALTRYLRERLRVAGFEIIDSPAPIVSFQYGKFEEMQALQRRLFDRGIYIYHSTYLGAGPEGMIRCAVFRDHSKEDIDALMHELIKSC